MKKDKKLNKKAAKKAKKNLTFGGKVDKAIGTAKYVTSKDTVTDFAKKNAKIFAAIGATLGFCALNSVGNKIRKAKKAKKARK